MNRNRIFSDKAIYCKHNFLYFHLTEINFHYLIIIEKVVLGLRNFVSVKQYLLSVLGGLIFVLARIDYVHYLQVALDACIGGAVSAAAVYLVNKFVLKKKT